MLADRERLTNEPRDPGGVTVLGLQLPILAPDTEIEHLLEAGFSNPRWFYAAFTFNGGIRGGKRGGRNGDEHRRTGAADRHEGPDISATMRAGDAMLGTKALMEAVRA